MVYLERVFTFSVASPARSCNTSSRKRKFSSCMRPVDVFNVSIKLTFALLRIHFAREANSSVEIDSRASHNSGEQQQIIKVLEFPPKLLERSLVNLLSR
jgi:hypothetical protein